MAGLCTFLSPGTATITATVDGRAYTTTATAAAPLSLLLEWAPLVRRSDLSNPIRASASVTQPQHNGCGTLGTSRVLFPKTADEWGGYAAYQNPSMNAPWTPTVGNGTATAVPGPYLGTTAWQIDATTAGQHLTMVNEDFQNVGTMDNQDVSTWKRGAALLIKAKDQASVGLQVKVGLTDYSVSGGAGFNTTFYSPQTITLTADYQRVYIEFADYATFSGFSSTTLAITTLTDNTSYVYAPYGSWAWHAHEQTDESNWFRPLPFHETLGLLTQFQTQNSWGSDSDNPTIYSQSPAGEIAYLQSHLSGGDSQILGLYSVLSGITTVSGAVSQWDDARGAVGHGPSLAQATSGRRPAWDSVNKLMTFDGATQELASALVTAFDLSTGKTLVLIGALNQSSNDGVTPAALSNAGVTALLGLRYDSGASATIKGQLNTGGPAVIPDSTVPRSSNRRLMAVSHDASSEVAIDVPTHARVTAATVQPTTGTVGLTVGDYQAAAGANAPIIVRAVLVLNNQVSAGDLSVLETWATTFHAAVLV